MIELGLYNKQAPGDVLMMTCLIRDLNDQYKDEYRLKVDTVAPELWNNNPHLYSPKFDRPEKVRHIKAGYSSSIQSSNQRRAHFASGFIQEFNEKMGTDIRLSELKPDLHLNENEALHLPNLDELKELEDSSGNIKPFWIIIAGGKQDFTTKIWDPDYYQELVDSLKDKITFVQMGLKKHIHRPLEGTINLLNKTSIRDWISLTYHSKGAVCPITCQMHLCAAFNKPCVGIAGGREPWWWEAYTRETWKANAFKPVPRDFISHRYLHTIGKLDCCKYSACWKSGVGENRSGNNCLNIVKGSSRAQPKCMTMITPDMVKEAILDYENGNPIEDQKIPDHLKAPLFLEPRPVNTKKGYRVVGTTNVTTKVAVDEAGRRIYGPKKKKRKVIKTLRTYKTHRVKKHVKKEKPEQPENKAMKSDQKPETGKITIAVLGYGNYQNLLSRCLTSIYKNADQSNFDLILGLNAPSSQLRKWADRFIKSKNNAKIVVSDENIHKYPMMRKMLYEPKIDTKWLVWFDDDSHVVKSDWFSKLIEFLNSAEFSMIGKKYFYHITSGQVEWIKKADWYTGRDIRTRKGKPKIDFVTGGYWIINVKDLYKLNWPDPRIDHNGGDVMLGEACWQNRMPIKQYHYGVKISNAKRRGTSQKHPGK
jgi:ADP-heptose:LPS heptosyltransferase